MWKTVGALGCASLFVLGAAGLAIAQTSAGAGAPSTFAPPIGSPGSPPGATPA